MITLGATRAISASTAPGSSVWWSTSITIAASKLLSPNGMWLPSYWWTGIAVPGRTSTSMPSMRTSGRNCITSDARSPLPQPTSSTRASPGSRSAIAAASRLIRRSNTNLP
jgi:hypothetical protein